MKSRFIKRRTGPTALLADFAAVWNELFPAEQARVVQLLVERTDVHEDAFELEVQGDEPEALHTAALQTSDRITSGDPVTLRVYQLSSVRGRGIRRPLQCELKRPPLPPHGMPRGDQRQRDHPGVAEWVGRAT